MTSSSHKIQTHASNDLGILLPIQKFPYLPQVQTCQGLLPQHMCLIVWAYSIHPNSSHFYFKFSLGDLPPRFETNIPREDGGVLEGLNGALRSILLWHPLVDYHVRHLVVCLYGVC